MQLYADIYLLLNYSAYFGRPSRPSSGVHKNVVAASGADRIIWKASFFKRDQIRSQSLFGHDGRKGRPKLVEYFYFYFFIFNILLTVHLNIFIY